MAAIELSEELTKICSNAFYGCTALPSITIPNKVTSIEQNAFSHCALLSSVILSNKLDFLGGSAFYDCDALTAVTIPKSLRNDDYYSHGPFYKCSNLKNVSFENGITSIAKYLFDGCDGLTSITIPDTATEIKSNAFSNCANLNSVSVPASITTFGGNAFYNCKKATFYCPMDSYATVYAIANSIPFISTSDSFEDSENIYLNRGKSDYKTSQTALSASGTVDFNLEYDFKDSAQDRVSDLQIEINLPKNTQLINSSLRLNGSTITSFTNVENLLKINLSEISGSIRFSVKPDKQTLLTSIAQASFKIDGVTYKEIVGIVNTSFPFLTVEADDAIDTATFHVSGIALAQKQVGLYVDDELFTTVTSSLSGKYGADITLSNLQDYKNYTVKAVSTSDDGSEISISKVITYSENYPTIVSFEMTYNGKNYNLIDTAKSKPIITFVPGKSIAFSVGFENGDQIEHVCIVSNRNNVKKYLTASFDESSQKYITSGYFDPENMSYVPGVITVEFSKQKAAVTPGYDVDFTSDIFMDSLPAGALDSQVTVINDTPENYEAELTFAGVLGETITDPIEIVVTSEDRVYGPNYMDLIEQREGYQSYLLEGKNDNDIILNIDRTFKEKLVMNVHDVSSNKTIKYILKYSDEGNGNFDTVLETMDTVSQISGILTNMYEIENDDEELHNRIISSGMTYEEMETAFKKADELKNDRQAFLTVATIISIIAATASTGGMAGPALLFSCLFGAINSASSFFWDARMAGILSGGQLSASWKWKIDPSGYVYEAVTSNRLQGVTAAAYWKETASSAAQLWDASEWEQYNPLTTDSNGWYSWDTPEGLWQVKYELSGYQTAYSEWLPVPPPQTEVNIGMVSLNPPEIISLNVYDTYAEVEFSKYMMPATISFLDLKDASNRNIPFTLEYRSDETSPDGTVYAKRFKLKYTNLIARAGGEYTVATGNGEKSYAGVEAVSNSLTSNAISTGSAVRATGIELNNSSLSLDAGESYTLQATVKPYNAANTSVIWESSNGAVATVSNGTVHAVAYGTATIKATSLDGWYTAQCDITVKSGTFPVSITCQKTDATLYGAANGTITVTASGGNSGLYKYSINNGVNWQSSGYFGNVMAGAYTVVVIDANNATNRESTLVVIGQPRHIGSFLAKNVPTKANKGTAFTVLPPAASKGYNVVSIAYSSTNPSVATVDANGNVTFLAGGKVTIITKVVSQTVDKKGKVKIKTTTVKKTITVNQLIETISLNLADTTIARTQKVSLAANIAPSTASNKKLTWKSSNPKVAAVSGTGVVTGKAGGIAIITCTAKDGSGASASCVVTVTPIYPTAIKLSKVALTVKLGKTASLKATITPKNTDFKTVTWTSSNPDVATVDAKGRIKALSSGTAVITATTSNGISATCTVTVP